MARLIVRYPNNVIREVEFDQPEYRIGSGPDNDLVLEEGEVSPRQAVIETAQGVYTLVDVSENGTTTVNGKRVERTPITYGDRISFGSVMGLFYPAKRGGIAGKTKLYLYVAAGGAVILLSIVFIFFLTTRQISTVVSERIGESLVTEGQAAAQGQPEAGGGITGESGGTDVTGTEPAGTGPAETVVAEKESAVPDQSPFGQADGGEEGKGKILGLFRRLGGSRNRGYAALTLPEPSLSEIRSREARAVPGGFRRLFMRKIPVRVQVTEKEISAGGEVSPGAGWLSRITEPLKRIVGGGSPEVEVVSGEEKSATSEEPSSESPAQGQTAGGTAQTSTAGGGSPEKGATGQVSDGGNDGGSTEGIPSGQVSQEQLPQGETPAGETAAGGTPETETAESGVAGGEEAASSSSAENVKEVSRDLERITDPLSRIRAADIPEMREPDFVEKPVYGEGEDLSGGKGLIDSIRLSDVENADLETLWQYSLPAGDSSSILRTGTLGDLDRDREPDFLFSNTGNDLIAVDGKTGEELFVESFEEGFYEPVIADMNDDGENNIFLVFESGRALLLGMGLERIWEYNAKDRVTAKPMIADLNGDGAKDAVMTTLGMEIVAVDGATGFELWRYFDASSEVLHSPVGIPLNDDGIDDVLFVTRRGVLHALDGRTGWGLWKRSIGGRPAGPPAVGDLNDDGKRDIVTLTTDGVLSAFDRSGNALFVQDTGQVFRVAPSLGDVDGDGLTEIVLADDDGFLRVLSGDTRQEEWGFRSDEGVTITRIALADVDGRRGMEVIFSTLSGAVFVMEGNLGSLLAQYNCSTYLFSTPLVGDVNADRVNEILLSPYGGSAVALRVADADRPFFSFLVKRNTGWASVNGGEENRGYATSRLETFISLNRRKD